MAFSMKKMLPEDILQTIIDAAFADRDVTSRKVLCSLSLVDHRFCTWSQWRLFRRLHIMRAHITILHNTFLRKPNLLHTVKELSIGQLALFEDDGQPDASETDVVASQILDKLAALHHIEKLELDGDTIGHNKLYAHFSWEALGKLFQESLLNLLRSSHRLRSFRLENGVGFPLSPFSGKALEQLQLIDGDFETEDTQIVARLRTLALVGPMGLADTASILKMPTCFNLRYLSHLSVGYAASWFPHQLLNKILSYCSESLESICLYHPLFLSVQTLDLGCCSRLRRLSVIHIPSNLTTEITSSHTVAKAFDNINILRSLEEISFCLIVNAGNLFHISHAASFSSLDSLLSLYFPLIDARITDASDLIHLKSVIVEVSVPTGGSSLLLYSALPLHTMSGLIKRGILHGRISSVDPLKTEMNSTW